MSNTYAAKYHVTLHLLLWTLLEKWMLLCIVQGSTSTHGDYFYLIPNLLLTSSSSETKEAQSAFQCVLLCHSDYNCRSVSFQATTQVCHLNRVSLTDPGIQLDYNTDWVYYESDKRNPWKMVLRATSAIGKSVIEAWTNTGHHDNIESPTEDNIGCSTVRGSLTCDRHARSWRLDVWDRVAQVKWALYDDTNEVFYATFDVSGAPERDTAFNMSSIVDSSSGVLAAGAADVPENLVFGVPSCRRRFYLFEYLHDGCHVDRSWMLVLDGTPVTTCCSFDFTHPSHPDFMYSTIPNAKEHYSGYMAFAKVFAVFFKYED